MIRDSLLSVAARLLGAVAIFRKHVARTRSLGLNSVGDFVTGYSFFAVLGIFSRVAAAAAEICGRLVSNLIADRTLGFMVRPSLWQIAPRKA